MTDSYLRRHYAVTIAGGIVLAIGYSSAQLHYLRYFRLGAPFARGSIMLIFLLLVSILLAVGLSFVLLGRSESRGVPCRRAMVRSLAGVAVVFVLLYTIVLCRTADGRGPDAAQDTLADYAASIFGIR
jgi:hypothetical protein